MAIYSKLLQMVPITRTRTCRSIVYVTVQPACGTGCFLVKVQPEGVVTYVAIGVFNEGDFTFEFVFEMLMHKSNT